MAQKIRTPMSRENRAKQFMPFAALKGYEEALRQKEKIIVPKIELTEERKEELDEEFAKLRKCDMATVVYFCRDEYLKITGMVARIDTNARILTIVNTGIPFDDIYELHALT